MAAHQVRALLMGGQACVFYGGAEFSRDTDLAILADNTNWERLNTALRELMAECIAVPPSELSYLLRGFALHFRCHHPEADGMRIDVMSVMRGVEPFDILWRRRTTLEGTDGVKYELLSLPDLVLAKKTQRSKDWPMIKRLVEADFLLNQAEPSNEQIRFWMLNLRTPEMLVRISASHRTLAEELAPERELLQVALVGDLSRINELLESEEKKEKELDRIYWEPLKAELERLRHQITKQ